MKTRLYGKHSRERLVTWSQRRCEICQRFLATKELRYCKKCAKEGYLKVTKKLNLVTEQVNICSMGTLRELIGIPLSKETRLWLRCYV